MLVPIVSGRNVVITRFGRFFPLLRSVVVVGRLVVVTLRGCRWCGRLLRLLRCCRWFRLCGRLVDGVVARVVARMFRMLLLLARGRRWGR